jgi:Protein of unknown function (DUF3592)
MGQEKAIGVDAAWGWRVAAAGALLFLLALLVWTSRTTISSWFASSFTATIELTTTTETDDARIQRAFASALSVERKDASLELVPGLRQIRHSIVHVPAPSRAEAIAAAGSLSKEIAAAFDAEGPGQVEAKVGRRTDPSPGPASSAVLSAVTCAALAIALAGLAVLWNAWRRWPIRADGMSRAAAFGVIAIAVLAFLPLALPGWMVMALFAMAIPGAIAGAIVYKMQQVKRAARWPSAQGRIVRSQLRVVRHRQADRPSTTGNVPDVEYVFSVGGTEFRGKRISIGEIPAGSPQVAAALERYQVGRTGPVFYNPDDPNEAVLERDPPISTGAMYGIAAGVMLVGFAVVVAFTRIGEIIDWLQPHLPAGAVVQGVLFFGAAGIMMLLFLISNWRTASAAARWPTTTGTILSSVAEPHRTLVPGGRGQTATMWSSVIEYSYRVQDRDYHGTRLAFGADVAGPRDLAEKTAARYPVGSKVTVHFDPANPSWLTSIVTAAFFGLALFFSGWR